MPQSKALRPVDVSYAWPIPESVERWAGGSSMGGSWRHRNFDRMWRRGLYRNRWPRLAFRTVSPDRPWLEEYRDPYA
jgi:hypothetical protein